MPEVSEEVCIRRVEELASWRSDSNEAVERVGRLLGFERPAYLLDDPRAGLFELDELCSNDEVEDISEGEDAWLASHLIAYVGQYFIRKYTGEWEVDTNIESDTYGKYVVSVRSPHGQGKYIDVPQAVMDLLSDPPGRSLLGLIQNIERNVAD